jgi:hypothetical protein
MSQSPRGGPEPGRPRRPFLSILLALAALAAAGVVPAAAARPVGSSSGSASAAEATAVRDTVLTTAKVRSLRTSSAFWGGKFTADTGEDVTVFLSDTYPQDTAVGQRWANFLASLAHGSELSAITTYLAPLGEVQRVCGNQALACYSVGEHTLVAPADDVGGLSAEAIVAHEYGHHVAANRDNAPWPAVDWGTKRWASYIGVCARTRAGELFPGAESDDRYRLNPGEAFAEGYRVLNERKLGLAESPWQIVSLALYPDPTALALLDQDVVDPWRGNTTSTIRGSFTSRGARVRTSTVATTLDGTMRVSLRAPVSARLRLDLISADGSRVARAGVSGGTRSVQTTICGSRSYRLRVTRLAGAGAYRLTVSKP